MLDINGTVTSRRWALMGLLTTALLLSLLLLVKASDTDSAGPPTLDSVPARFLEGMELQLGIPEVETSVVSKSRAEAVASEHYPGKRVLESVLAHCVAPTLDQTCWVVSMKPSGMASSAGTPSHPEQPRTFNHLVVLVDAQSGEFATAFAGT